MSYKELGTAAGERQGRGGGAMSYKEGLQRVRDGGGGGWSHVLQGGTAAVERRGGGAMSYKEGLQRLRDGGGGVEPCPTRRDCSG